MAFHHERAAFYHGKRPFLVILTHLWHFIISKNVVLGHFIKFRFFIHSSFLAFLSHWRLRKSNRWLRNIKNKVVFGHFIKIRRFIIFRHFLVTGGFGNRMKTRMKTRARFFVIIWQRVEISLSFSAFFGF